MTGRKAASANRQLANVVIARVAWRGRGDGGKRRYDSAAGELLAASGEVGLGQLFNFERDLTVVKVAKPNQI